MAHSPFNLANHDLSHGFLPAQDPIQSLPNAFSAWEQLARELPKRLACPRLRDDIKSLESFNIHLLENPLQLERAMLLLSYLGHAYVWNGGQSIANALPKTLALPWYKVAKQLARPPVLSYASYALYNWERLHPHEPIALGNIALLQNFLGGLDEEWFILIHVEIESKAIPALMALIPAQEAAVQKDHQTLTRHLVSILNALIAMNHTMQRMPENCDPYIYYNRVRPYIHGWKDNPALPNGLIYEGVEDYQGKPQKFKGETGAQSSIIPSLDAALGIDHENTPLKAHLQEMRIYMPKPHREFLEYLEQHSCIRQYLLSEKNNQSLRELYNECIKQIAQFRSTHIHYAAQYIQKQHQTSAANPTMVGTGGTPFMEYLRKHKDETEKYYI